MTRRRLLGGLAVAALTLCAGACKDKADATKLQPGAAEVAKPASAADLDKRCVQLGKVCGDQAKHVDKIVDACKQAAVKQAEKGCVGKAIALDDCYEKELCLGGDKVWALDDLHVLAERHGKCGVEQKAIRACVEN